MQIEESSRPGADWDAFVEAQPHARLGHAAAWAAVLNEAYGLEARYLCARDDSGRIGGVLPLVVFQSRPGGRRRLVSLPYLDGAGILASSQAAADALFATAQGLLAPHDLDTLELRHSHPALPIGGPASERPTVDRVNLVLDLEPDVEAQWKALRAKVRNQTRKAEREGLELADDADAGLLEGFYAPFCVNMRDLGSPVHSQRFFAAAAEHLGERLRFVVTRDGDRPVGGLVAIRFGERVCVPWASTLRGERRRCPNNQIYWEAIRWAIEAGARQLDFGRSPLSGGTYRFKKGWGALEEPLDWREFDASGPREPSASGGPSPLLERLSRVWTRLPVPVATFLGGRIRRYFAN